MTESFDKEFDALRALGSETFVLRGSTMVVEIMKDEEIKTKSGLIIATVLIWIIYDISVCLKSGNQSTISVVTYNWSKIAPGIIFAIGFICGHIFWQVHICN